MRKKIWWIAVVIATAGIGSCGAVDRIADCHQICDRYQSCFDDDYDRGACRSRCSDMAEEDREFERKVDSCETCIDDRSCTAATFACATECAGIVP